jgi:hypothetical protein
VYWGNSKKEFQDIKVTIIDLKIALEHLIRVLD